MMPSKTPANGRVTPKKVALAPISAAEWRSTAEDGFVVELPSGKVIKVRRTMDFMGMLQSGDIPNALRTIVMDALKTKDRTLNEDKILEKIDMEDLASMMKFMDTTVAKMCIEPRVYLPPSFDEWQMSNPSGMPSEYDNFCSNWLPSDDSGIPVRFLSDADKEFLFQLAQGGTADLATFRREASGGLAVVPDGSGVPKPAKRPARTTKR